MATSLRGTRHRHDSPRVPRSRDRFQRGFSIPAREVLPGVLLRKPCSKQAPCFMVFARGPIYGAFPTGDLPENGAKMNFAMEPHAAMAARQISGIACPGPGKLAQLELILLDLLR